MKKCSKELLSLSSAFKNFFITFGVCLIVFGLIGWQLVYPAIDNIMSNTSNTDVSEVSSDNSTDTSGEVTEPPIIVDEGETFTSVIIGKAADGLAASVIYLRVNESNKTFSYCYIPADTQIGSNIGKDVPIKYMATQIDGGSIAKKISALTGVSIDYYAVLGMEELTAVVGQLNEAYIDIPQEIKYPNPEFAEQIAELSEGEEIPDEYNIIIPQGRNTIDADIVKNIMNYNPTGGNEYHVLTKKLYETVFIQFFTNPGTKKNNSALYSLLNDIENTNITPGVIDKNLDLIFTYDVYQLNQINYPSNADWTRTIELFKDKEQK